MTLDSTTASLSSTTRITRWDTGTTGCTPISSGSMDTLMATQGEKRRRIQRPRRILTAEDTPREKLRRPVSLWLVRSAAWTLKILLVSGLTLLGIKAGSPDVYVSVAGALAGAASAVFGCIQIDECRKALEDEL